MLRTTKNGVFKKNRQDRRDAITDCRCDRCRDGKLHKHHRRELSATEQMHDDE